MRRILLLSLSAFLLLVTGILLGRTLFQKAPPPSSPPVAETRPQPEPAAEVTPALPQPVTSSDMVLDLFNPSDAVSQAQRSHSELSQQVEQAITTNFTLRQCNLITQQDYSDNYRAMLVYIERSGMAPTNAQARSELDRITEASNASYALIYSRTPCDTPQLAAAAAQLADWRNALLTSPTPPE